jgi:hypothetical protein
MIGRARSRARRANPTTSSVAPGPPVPSGWLADVLTLTATAGGAGNLETGIYFESAGTQVCTGILVEWQNSSVPTPTLALSLWNVATGLIATETVTLAAPGLAYTTSAFGSHTLTAGNTYCVSLREVTGAQFNQYVAPNPYTLPRAYAEYNVTAGYVYTSGAGIPTTVYNGCEFIEPVMA